MQTRSVTRKLVKWKVLQPAGTLVSLDPAESIDEMGSNAHSEPQITLVHKRTHAIRLSLLRRSFNELSLVGVR